MGWEKSRKDRTKGKLLELFFERSPESPSADVQTSVSTSDGSLVQKVNRRAATAQSSKKLRTEIRRSEAESCPVWMLTRKGGRRQFSTRVLKAADGDAWTSQSKWQLTTCECLPRMAQLSLLQKAPQTKTVRVRIHSNTGLLAGWLAG